MKNNATGVADNGKKVLAFSPLTPSKTVFYMAVVAVACLATYFLGGAVSFLFGTIVSTSFFAVVVAKGEQKISGAFTVAFFIIMLFICGGIVSTAFLYLMMFLPGGLALGLSTKKQKIFNSAVASSFLAFSAFIGILVIIFTVESTSPVSFASVLDMMNETMHNFIGSAYDKLSVYLPAQVVSMDKNDFVVTFYTSFVARIPFFLSIGILFVSSISFWVFKSIFLMAEKENNYLKYAFFGKFMYTKISRAGAVVYMLCNLILFFSPSGQDYMFFYNLSLVFTYMFAYSGIALIDFFLAVRYGSSKLIRAVVCGFLFCICAMPMLLSSIISLLGMVDSFYHLRRFINPKEDARYL